MSVLDASVFTDALVVAGPPGDAARRAVAAEDTLHVPEIFVIEVVSSIRGLHLAGEVSGAVARRALVHVREARIERYPIDPFIDRVWELRDNVTAYDASYVALAEWLEDDFVTADRRLAQATGPRCRIIHVGDVD